jgi:signal transduction histidine kinase
MRDLHDGLGLHLLSALQQARSASADPQLLTSTLQDCLDDLRVAVDSLAGDERDPAAVLGNLRYRMAPRLAAAGIRLDWEVEGEVPELPWLDAPAVLQLLRIVQEALSNAVRHSGARVVTISLRARAATLEVCVQDDGRHAGITERAGGRGLPSMKARAASLGASFELSGGPAGTRLVLGLPLSRQPPG